MAIEQSTLEQLLRRSFPDAGIEIIDTAGDQDHYELLITDSRFNSIPLVKQHKMVYDALGDIVGTTLHALSIKTKGTK